MPDVTDVVILTPLAIEAEAAMSAIGTCNVRRWRGLELRIGEVAGQSVLIYPMGGMGNVRAAQAAEAVISTWKPAALLLVGIAGGARSGSDDLRLGDVLVAEQVVGYELAKIAQGSVIPRYEVYRPDPELLATAHSVGTAEWALELATPRPDRASGRVIPRVHFGPLLSGDKVVADSPVLDQLRLAWPKAIGIEMESVGVALAAHQRSADFLTVRAACDFADAEKNDDWHQYAAEAAARFAVAVIRRLAGTAAVPVVHSSGPSYPGRLKLEICNRLHDTWEDVADAIAVPAHEKARFRHGNQARNLWEWLEARNRLGELPGALDAVGRNDLAALLRAAS